MYEFEHSKWYQEDQGFLNFAYDIWIPVGTRPVWKIRTGLIRKMMLASAWWHTSKMSGTFHHISTLSQFGHFMHLGSIASSCFTSCSSYVYLWKILVAFLLKLTQKRLRSLWEHAARLTSFVCWCRLSIITWLYQSKIATASWPCQSRVQHNIVLCKVCMLTVLMSIDALWTSGEALSILQWRIKIHAEHKVQQHMMTLIS